jgi:dihydrofolate synthase/folylpolyglutamate synthase
MVRKTKSYQEAVNYLYSLQKFGIKFGLSKTSNLLNKFGNPHKGQKYVHIAGTNGKGSVAAFAASILNEAGFKVGLYSSPHLVRFTERFRINGVEMPPDKAVALIEELRNIFDPEEPPTFFEATTAMALLYFARENTDIAIMEVGMGGRLDATNVITPIVSVITNIFLEHKFFLGNRLLDIAKEKAGIIKQKVDLIAGATQKPVAGLFKSIAKEKKAPFMQIGKDIRYRHTSAGLHYYGLKHKFNRLELGLKGSFQQRNAAISLAVIELLDQKGFKISSRAIRDGLKKTVWAGRMQVVAKDPTIILDGAHNPAAVRTLADCIKKDFEYDRLILVIGVMEDKEISKLLREIVPVSDYVVFTSPVYSRAARPEKLKKDAGDLNQPCEVIGVLRDAIDRAREIADPHDLILVCGSLFIVGEALTFFDPVTYTPDETYNL